MKNKYCISPTGPYHESAKYSVITCEFWRSEEDLKNELFLIATSGNTLFDKAYKNIMRKKRKIQKRLE